MTWFKAYGRIRPDPAGTIYIPTKHGRGYAELQVETEDSADSSQEAEEMTGTVSAVAAREQDIKAPAQTQGLDLENYIEDLQLNGEHENKKDADLPQEVKDLLDKHTGTFFENAGLGKVQVAEHTIPMEDNATPVRSRPYRLA